MNKLKSLLDRGWHFDARATGDGWYDVGLSHNSYGNISAIKDNFTEAVNDVIQQAKQIEKELGYSY